MMIHPVMLYTGFTGFALPFSFAFAALVTGELGTTWFRTTRRWTLFAWSVLSVGIMLGGRWAYEVLGWGGYWAWDPVENASLMPWLAGTAYIHSVMIQEKRDMLRTWNIVLDRPDLRPVSVRHLPDAQRHRPVGARVHQLRQLRPDLRRLRDRDARGLHDRPVVPTQGAPQPEQARERDLARSVVHHQQLDLHGALVRGLRGNDVPGVHGDRGRRRAGSSGRPISTRSRVCWRWC